MPGAAASSREGSGRRNGNIDASDGIERAAVQNTSSHDVADAWRSIRGDSRRIASSIPQNALKQGMGCSYTQHEPSDERDHAVALGHPSDGHAFAFVFEKAPNP